jgi:hypothetical protein
MLEVHHVRIQKALVAAKPILCRPRHGRIHGIDGQRPRPKDAVSRSNQPVGPFEKPEGITMPIGDVTTTFRRKVCR